LSKSTLQEGCFSSWSICCLYRYKWRQWKPCRVVLHVCVITLSRRRKHYYYPAFCRFCRFCRVRLHLLSDCDV